MVEILLEAGFWVTVWVYKTVRSQVVGRRCRRVMKKTGRALGLRFTESWNNFTLAGELSGCRGGIVCTPGEKGDWDFMIRLQSPQAVTFSLALSPAKDAPDVPLRDRGFQDAMRAAKGEKPVILAFLSERVRKVLPALFVDASLVVENGAFQWQSKGSVPLERLIDAAAAMGIIENECRRDPWTEDGIIDRLARNAREDPLPLARAENLRWLQRSYPARAETIEACRRALRDEDPEVCLLGAAQLGDEGMETLLSRLEGAPDGSAVAALEHAASTGSPDKVGPFLARALESTRTPVRQKAADILSFLGYAPALENIWDLALQARPDDLPPYISAFARLGGSAVEQRVWDWLGFREDPVQIAAARALGEFGTVQSVEPLMTCIKNSNLLEGSVKDECRTAVTKIQMRVTGVDRGALSLPPGNAVDGALSLGGGGELTLNPAHSPREASS